MNNTKQRFQDKIEVERMWVSTQQAGYSFFCMLPVTALLVFGLWDVASHRQLILWFILWAAVSFIFWMVLRFYHTHKKTLSANLGQFKRILLLVTAFFGLVWAMAIVWFLVPSQPVNVLTISFALIIHVVGVMLTAFYYLPAVIIASFPPAILLISLLFLQGGDSFIAPALILSLLTVYGVTTSFRLSGILDHALYLNFENAALRREADEKSDLLKIALEESKQANAAKTRFLASASHDLRQPIHALGLFFAELSDRVYSPETALVIGQVEDSITAINSMLNALLDVSKLDAGVVKPNIEPFILGKLFIRLQGEFKQIALENHNALHFRQTTAKVNTDPAMLEQMLRNLIGNALRYTKNGRILVAARPRGENIEIQVWDTGSGIPDNQLDEIFMEFHQLHNPARDRRQGLGLGLAIVKRLGNLLNHDIKVVSRLGHGSCFSIILPLAHDTANNFPERQITKNYLSNHSLAGRSILVVDDDIAVQDGMKGLLTRWGSQVTTASSPDELMEKLISSEQKFELLIIDYRLQENISGIEVARNLQANLGYPIAVLIITGDTGPERLREADASGYPLLHKPVEPAKLRSTLQYLLMKSNADNKLFKA